MRPRSKVLGDSDLYTLYKESSESNLPARTEQRRKNDACMVPDRGFTKQLKKIDEEYDVIWNWVNEIWEIWHFPTDGTIDYMITAVCSKGKTYKELSAEILLGLQENYRKKVSALDVLDYLEEAEEQNSRRKRKNFLNLIEDISLDTYDYIHAMKIQVPKAFKIAEVAHA